MDILGRINELRNQRGWSVNRLALESELTQSTVFNMLYRKSLPTIRTLQSLCKGFGISLGEFFMESNKNIYSLSLDEKAIIDKYRKINSEQRKLAREFLVNIE